MKNIYLALWIGSTIFTLWLLGSYALKITSNDDDSNHTYMIEMYNGGKVVEVWQSKDTPSNGSGYWRFTDLTYEEETRVPKDSVVITKMENR